MEDVLKWIGALVVATLSAVTGWLIRMVLGNREDNIRQTEKLIELEGKVSAVITKEDIREIIDHALTQRDTYNAVRRKEWDAHLELRIKQAVLESAVESRADLEQILRRVLDQRDAG